MCDQKIEEWIKLALQNEDLLDYKIKEIGQTRNDEGYLGNIYFIKIKGKTRKNESKIFDFAIKASKEGETLRQQVPIKKAFYKEIFIYNQVYKSFENFQKETTSENFLDMFPYCYVTQVMENSELLIFENLKVKGFTNWDRKLPMNFDHLKLVIEAYGKWHAFSFALKEKKNKTFQELIKDNINMFSYFCQKSKFDEVFLDLFQKSRDICIAKNETEIVSKINFTQEDLKYNFNDLYFADLEHSVIQHGDCWNNNFLFGYRENETKPYSVRILDWQCSGLASPVFDLSHFLYSCCDTERYKDVSLFLKIYHESLRQCLEALGCNPSKLFPYSKLVEHWKRFSRFGILLHAFVLKFSVIEACDAPDIAVGAEQGKDFLENFNFEISNEDEYYRRVRNNLIHYVNNLNISAKF